MKEYVYLRVSTVKQSYEQQLQDLKNYGVDFNKIAEIVEEKESGGKSYVDRKLQKLLQKCESGDVIYVASTDRLGRNFSDMVRLMEDAMNRGITIIACKQNLSLKNGDVATKIILAITSIMDEDERMRIQHRIKNAFADRKEQIAKNGYYVVKNGVNAGTVKTHLGNEKGCDMSAANQASLKVRQANSEHWKATSKAYQWVREQALRGKPRKQIIEEFNELHKMMPTEFCTPKGYELNKGTLSRWISEMGL